MPELVQDLRYVLRLLRKTPTVTAVAVMSLALGIGANTAIFGVINALMLRSLPVSDPQRLVNIGGIDPAHPDGGDEISLAMCNEIRHRADAFSDVFAWSGGGMSNFEANSVSYTGSLDEVSGNYFAALGVRPVLGRVLTRRGAPLDERPSAQVAVITYACWQHRFAGDPGVIGKTIRVDGTPLSIVGVSPEDFAGLMIGGGPEATVPIGFTGREIKYRENFWYNVFARLKPGFTAGQARAQIQVLWPGVLKAAAPDSYRGAVTRRTTEIGVRMALGAARADVLFMILGEVLRLLAIGIAIAIPLAFASGKLVSGMLFGVTVTDRLMVAIASSMLIAVAAIAGFLPARRASRVDPMTALRAE